MSSASAAHLSWQQEGDQARTLFFAEGMRCANCAAAIRREVGALPGVERIDVNLATSRVSLAWNLSLIHISEPTRTIESLGFRPVPLSGESTVREREVQRRSALKRIGVAGLVSMQMSMYTVGLYAGAFSGIDADMETLLRVTSMLLALPVLLYSGLPFLRGAWLDLRRRSLGMDTPVALALVLAFAASAWNTLARSGEVYYDSVAMFVFLLLLGRYIEQSLRRGSLDAGEALARSLPAQVTQVLGSGTQRVPLGDVQAGDRLRVARGAVVPVDALLESEVATLDESLISGESLPVSHRAGDRVMGGSVNVSGVIEVIAQARAEDSTLAAMGALIERAQAERPPMALLAERAAVQFVSVILLLALLVAGVWLWFDPTRAFAATLAVLVVTCPCALSLATPAAVAAASVRLSRRGVMVTRAHALERLAGIDTVAIDKTGTLTGEHIRVLAVHTLGEFDAEHALRVAAALESGSTHPLAVAFNEVPTAGLVPIQCHEFAGEGVEGTLEGRLWRVGRAEWVARLAPMDGRPGEFPHARVWLGNDSGLVAAFELGDGLRTGAVAAVESMRRAGLELVVISGDRRAAVQQVAHELGIAKAYGGLDPQGKVAAVRELQQQGRRVLMIGDGINDAPVLAAADVSCAMGQGAALAQSASDLLLMNDSLAAVAESITTARGTVRLMRANLRWAMVYNLCAIPLAALGYVPPWLAAIGMSASSLYVVWRAHRFAHAPQQTQPVTTLPVPAVTP